MHNVLSEFDGSILIVGIRLHTPLHPRHFQSRVNLPRSVQNIQYIFEFTALRELNSFRFISENMHGTDMAVDVPHDCTL